MKNFKDILLVVLVILLAMVLWLYAFEIYLIPSNSMSNTLTAGDIVIVNKIAFGIRYKKNGTLHRKFATSKPVSGDILIFNFPEADTVFFNEPSSNYYTSIGQKGKNLTLADTVDKGKIVYQEIKKRAPYIKRCIGMPGDSLKILNGKVFINDEPYNEPPTYIKIPEPELPISRAINNFPDCYVEVFPRSCSYPWNRDNFGQLYIPKKGDTLILNKKSVLLYYRIISAYDKNQVNAIGDRIMINGELTDKYIVKQDYYFVLGDYRYYSTDSRYWGYLPDDHIIGKTNFILLSLNLSKDDSVNTVRWNRILRIINRIKKKSKVH